jgi:hypothetical protein
MCFTNPNLKNLHHWNWDGDVIIHDSIVPASRWVPGYSESRQYDIDIREFLISDRNELIKRTLQADIKQYLARIGGSWDRFTAREQGAFDYRVDIITAWVSENIRYKLRPGRDPWQFPDETLFVKAGDCEDRAFVIASLLLGSGISNFNVRLALGKVQTEGGTEGLSHYDHMWVMYKDESGHWIVIEPLHTRASTLATRKATAGLAGRNRARIIARYTPFFLFNDQHLWAIPSPHHPKSFANHVRFKKNWRKWNPTFAGAVHQTIIQQALASLPPEQHWVIDALNRRFSRAILGIAGPIVDDIDRDLKSYSPVDHFDNGYIKESWENVRNRLAAFNANNDDLDSFFHAAHGIADFYAHTSYVYFQTRNSSPAQVPLCDPDAPLPFVPGYDSDPFNLASGRFTVNPYYWKNQTVSPAQQWAGKLISGRYAQVKDTQPGLLNWVIEGRVNIPPALLAALDFYTRGALPHHNEIAVDDDSYDPKKHKLFSAAQYSQQLAWRKDCAIRHVKAAFFDNWHRAN